MHAPADPEHESAPPRVVRDLAHEDRRVVPWHLLPQGALPLPDNGVTISESAARIFGRMAERNPPTFFHHGGTVVELDTAGGVRVLDEAAFCSRIEKFGRVLVLRRSKTDTYWAPRPCSHADAKLLLATTEAAKLPPLALISNGPVALSDEAGRMRVLGKGYHRELGGVLVRDGELAEAGLPPPDEAAEALAGLLRDFSFLTPSDRSRALAAMISPALQFGNFLREPAPFDAGEADQSQSGKGYRAKLVAAIYGEELKHVSQSVGGVGSLDESFRTALASARPFVCVDNLRGRLDSTLLESFATADTFPCRLPGGRTVEVNPRRVFVFLTSNGIESTPDLANRCAIVRITKRPAAYRFHEWPEGDLLAHVRAHRLRYLAAAFSVVRAWVETGRLHHPEPGDHDRREWAGVLAWIVDCVFQAAPLLDGHRAAQERVSNPSLAWLRIVAQSVDHAARLGKPLTASNIAELCEEDGITLPGGRSTDGAEKVARHVGRIMGRLYRDAPAGTETIQADAHRVSRGETLLERHTDTGASDGTRIVKTYTFSKGGPSV